MFPFGQTEIDRIKSVANVEKLIDIEDFKCKLCNKDHAETNWKMEILKRNKQVLC